MIVFVLQNESKMIGIWINWFQTDLKCFGKDFKYFGNDFKYFGMIPNILEMIPNVLEVIPNWFQLFWKWFQNKKKEIPVIQRISWKLLHEKRMKNYSIHGKIVKLAA